GGGLRLAVRPDSGAGGALAAAAVAPRTLEAGLAAGGLLRRARGRALVAVMAAGRLGRRVVAVALRLVLAAVRLSGTLRLAGDLRQGRGGGAQLAIVAAV